MLYGFSQVILQGALVTLELALSSVVLAVLIGLAGAGAKLSSNRPLALVFEGYTTLIRGVPDLVLMLLIFYGLQIALNSVTDALGMAQFDIDPMIAGIITLGFIYGAYFTETFRGAYLAVPKGHIEAATAFGFSGGQILTALLLGGALLFGLLNLSGFMGCKTGVPFPVMSRISFGTRGAQIPALIRGGVAIAWFGIQTYLASKVLDVLVLMMLPQLQPLTTQTLLGLPLLGCVTGGAAGG